MRIGRVGSSASTLVVVRGPVGEWPLAGPLAAGKWSGLQNFVANLSGVIAPALTGIVVDRTGQFLWAFAVSAIVVLIGSAAYLFGLPRIEPVTWKARRQ